MCSRIREVLKTNKIRDMVQGKSYGLIQSTFQGDMKESCVIKTSGFRPDIGIRTRPGQDIFDQEFVTS